MVRKRPCSVCGKWFRADPRQGERQKTCGQQECRRELHRRSCVKWHRKNPLYDAHTRMQKRLAQEAPVPGPGGFVDPLRAINWPLARDEIGVGVATLVEEGLNAVLRWVRDAKSA